MTDKSTSGERATVDGAPGSTVVSADSKISDAPVAMSEAMAVDQEREFARAYVRARDSDGSATTDAPLDFLLIGLGVADTRCNVFMTQLGLAVQDLSFTNQEITLAGAATAAVQGLTKVATKEIAITSTLFGLGASSVNAYGSAYLFSPDITAIRGLISRTRDNFRQSVATIVETKGTPTFLDANTLLTNYETICTVDNIRSLINQSVKEGKVVTQFATQGDDAIDPVALERYPNVLAPTIAALKKVLPTTTIGENEVIALYGIWTLTAQPTATQDAVLSERLAGVPKLVKDGKLDPTVYGQLQKDVAAPLGPLVSSFKPILDAKLKTMLATPTTVAAAAPVPAVPPTAPAPALAASPATEAGAATTKPTTAAVKALSRSVSTFSFTQSIQPSH